MNTLGIFLVVLLSLFCVSFSYPSSKEFITEINSKAKTWTAGVNENFLDWSEVDLKNTYLDCWSSRLEKKHPRSQPITIPAGGIPVNFTASANWPQCSTIGTIYNQARCGSCWAFGGVEAASDRFCIASKGAINQIMSFAQVTECDSYSDGCDGGSAGSTWDFIQTTGIVSDDCYPYFIPTCPPSQQPCLNFVSTPYCWTNNTCANGQPWTLHTVNNVYSINSVQDAQMEIMTNGPIEACFEVYSDFLNYKSGVYIYTSGTLLGGHCIKISGWGVLNGVPYWLCNNSWTTFWGDNGYFKIERGVDMCGIEDSLVAGTPNV